MRRATAFTLALIGVASIAAAQAQKPRLELAASVTPVHVTAGTRARATLRVTMPANVHIQSDKPNDPTLIPTVLTVDPPAGVTVERIVYPAPSSLAQAGRPAPLAVFGPELTLEIHLSIASTAAAGEIRVPATLRYQACDDRVCFAPARQPAQWTFTVVAR